MPAVVDRKKCDACGACVEVCPVEAIKLNEVAEVDAEECVECEQCVDECPNQAISMQE